MIPSVFALVNLLAGKPTIVAEGEFPRIRNELQQCLDVKADHPRTEENLWLLPVHLAFSASVGKCGCRSGGIRYRVYETYQGRLREMNSGTLNSIPRMASESEALLVLNPDTMIHRTGPFRVDLTCEQ